MMQHNRQASFPLLSRVFTELFHCRVGVLVLSSCYMAFKIVALEHRLNSLASTAEHIHNG